MCPTTSCLFIWAGAKEKSSIMQPEAARYNSLPTGKRALLLSTKCAQLLLPKGTVLFTNGDAKTLCAHPAVMLTKIKHGITQQELLQQPTMQ